MTSLISPQQIADRLLAIVNESVITQTDVRVFEAFLFPEEEASVTKSKQILDRLIDQKLVVQMTDLEISVLDQELEERLLQIMNRMGADRFQERLDSIGMDKKDLKAYIKDGLMFDRIISRMFEGDVFVSLSEIEAYYDQTYIPERTALGREVPFLLDVAGDIESIVKKQKIDKKAVDWIKGLRRDADIKIFDE